jgi:hypothetical protein
MHNHHEMQKFDLNKTIKDVSNTIVENFHFVTSSCDYFLVTSDIYD